MSATSAIEVLKLSSGNWVPVGTSADFGASLYNSAQIAIAENLSPFLLSATSYSSEIYKFNGTAWATQGGAISNTGTDEQRNNVIGQPSRT